MDHTLVFKYISMLLICTGCINIVIPLITQNNSRIQLTLMLITSGCYILSVMMLGLLYVKTGIAYYTLIDFGRFSIVFHLEALGWIFLTLLSVLWFISIIYAHGYSENNKHHAFISVCIVVASLTALSANVLTMFIFYEILTLCTIPLVYSGSIEALEKYLRPLLYPSLLLFLPVMVYISYAGQDVSNIVILLLCIFGISKTAIMPFHTWLPAAMIATHPVSALLHGVAIVNTGIFVLCKILLYELNIATYQWLIIIPGITMLYSGFKALLAKDIKQILAYSTINQAATCLIGALLLSKSGITSSIIFIIAHSFAKIALFFIAGNIYLMHGKSKIEDLKGLFYQMPSSVILFILSGASLIGIPFIAGGIGKSAIISAAIEAGNTPAVVIMVIGSILTFAYLARVIYTFFTRNGQCSIIPEKYSLSLFLPIIACNTVIIGFSVIAPIIEKLMSFV